VDKKKFDKYFALVQEAATKQGKIFFMDTGEGREHATDDMDMEDLSGWLVPVELEEEFAQEWGNNIRDEWDAPFYRFAIWSIDDSGKVQVEFKNFGFWDLN